MRVLLVAESYLPHMNGVTRSILHVVDHVQRSGGDAMIVAPGTWRADGERANGVARLPSLPLPRYPQVRVAAGGVARLARLMREYRPDVVHLASPFVLGWRAVMAAHQLGVPSVAVYQTDVPEYAARYGIPGVETLLWQHVARLHRRATLTLAPSRHCLRQLLDLGVERVSLWPRGVDAQQFHPRHRRENWRRRFSPSGETVIGYVGRLAPEKQVDDLRALSDLPGTRLAIIGEGPERARLHELLPAAEFTGFLAGDDLSQALASCDVFVHPGGSETFCQTLQEAMASEVPVVAVGRGGPVDIVTQGVTGWLYAPGDLASLRTRVADLAGDRAKRRAFGVAGREWVLPRSWDAVCARLDDYYEEAIEESAVTAA